MYRNLDSLGLDKVCSPEPTKDLALHWHAFFSIQSKYNTAGGPFSKFKFKRKMPPKNWQKVPEKCNTSTNPNSIVQDIEDFSPDQIRELRSNLLIWYDVNHRLLPWRKEVGENAASREEEEQRAYGVWVSEVMLQQTRVATVVDYYKRWMEKWPTVACLAEAGLEEVNEMWAGLGYYRRARFLLEGAKTIVKGTFPQTAAELKRVPGIGDYTAGAIASIAFNEAVPVVDGNVVRVISRLKTISANPKESTTVKSIWKLAGQLVDPLRPGDFNQAIMELGATLCTVTSPNCFSCPISNQCNALAASIKGETVKVTDYPTKVIKAIQRKEFAAVCVIEIQESSSYPDNGYLLVKRPEEGLLAGLWEFPSVLVEEEKTDMVSRRRAIDVYLKDLFGIDFEKNCKLILREEVGEYLHIFSHIRLKMHVEFMVLSLKGGLSLRKSEDESMIVWKCVDKDSIKSLGLTSSVRKVYNMTQECKRKQVSKQPKSPTRKRIRKVIRVSNTLGAND